MAGSNAVGLQWMNRCRISFLNTRHHETSMLDAVVNLRPSACQTICLTNPKTRRRWCRLITVIQGFQFLTIPLTWNDSTQALASQLRLNYFKGDRRQFLHTVPLSSISSFHLAAELNLDSKTVCNKSKYVIEGYSRMFSCVLQTTWV